MEPEAGVGVCVCPVRIFESSLDVSDGAILASYLDARVFEVLHAIVDVHRRHNERTVCNFHPLGALIGEELRSECGDI